MSRVASFAFKDTALAEVLDQMARTAGYSVRVPVDLDLRATFRLKEVPVGVAWHLYLGMNNLDFSCDGTMLDVYIAESPGRAILRVFPVLPDADAAALASAIRVTLLSGTETIEPLPAGNALRFTGRLSTSRRVAFVLDRLSGLVAP